MLKLKLKENINLKKNIIYGRENKTATSRL